MCEEQQSRNQGILSSTEPHYANLVTSGEGNQRSESDMPGKQHTCAGAGATRHVGSCHRSLARDREPVLSSTHESSHINRSRAAVVSVLVTSQPLYDIVPLALISQGVGQAFSFLDVLELTQCRKVAPLQTENFSFGIILLRHHERSQAASIPYHVLHANDKHQLNQLSVPVLFTYYPG